MFPGKKLNFDQNKISLVSSTDKNRPPTISPPGNIIYVLSTLLLSSEKTPVKTNSVTLSHSSVQRVRLLCSRAAIFSSACFPPEIFSCTSPIHRRDVMAATASCCAFASLTAGDKTRWVLFFFKLQRGDCLVYSKSRLPALSSSSVFKNGFHWRKD